MEYKLLDKTSLSRLAEIDRSEVVKEVYYMRDGELVLEEEFYDIKEWDKKELTEFIERLHDIYDRGGTIYGAFDEEKLAGLISLESKFMGKNGDRLKLDMLYIDSNYRKKGIGRKLMTIASQKAVELGAKSLYISATPFKNTVDFYRSCGAAIAEEVDEELFKLEPYDIHMILKL